MSPLKNPEVTGLSLAGTINSTSCLFQIIIKAKGSHSKTIDTLKLPGNFNVDSASIFALNSLES